MWFCLTNSVRGSLRSWGAFPVTCACIQVCLGMIMRVYTERASLYIENDRQVFFFFLRVQLFFNCVILLIELY